MVITDYKFVFVNTYDTNDYVYGGYFMCNIRCSVLIKRLILLALHFCSASLTFDVAPDSR